ncbi:hypothetical protein ISCGN_010656 [Ixodes scapularis]
MKVRSYFFFYLQTFFVTGENPGYISVAEFKTIKEEQFTEIPDIDVERDLIALCFTSGTTGRPKAVEETHYSCVAGLQPYRLNMMFDQAETVGAVFSCAMPVGFRMLLRVVCSGATCVNISEGTSFQEMVNTVCRYQITTLFADSMAVHQLAANMLRSGIRLPSVKHVVVIAIRVTERAAETIMSAFDLKSFRSMYGTTEYANVISWLPRETMEYNTIGFPAPDVKIKIVDIDTGRVVGPGELGELWAKSPTSMRAYHNNPEATRTVVTPDGWLKSGSSSEAPLG